MIRKTHLKTYLPTHQKLQPIYFLHIAKPTETLINQTLISLTYSRGRAVNGSFPALETKMARVYSRKHGKSGSTKPVVKTKPSWLTYKPKEVEALVMKLAKSGSSSAKIGLVLRDTYGIPSVKDVTGKRIVQIMKENKSAPKLPEDLSALILKFISVAKHREMNKHDQTAKRGMNITESKIKRLTKYYKAQGVLPREWVFDKAKAKLLVE